jgi:CBS domain-containing protein
MEARMRLETIMTAPVEVVSPRASIRTAQAILNRKGIHHLVVVDGGAVVGLATSDTLKNRQQEGATCVADAMLRNIAVLTPDTSVQEAANLMTPGHVQTAIPLLRGKRLVGIVTVSDLLELAGRA